MRIVIIGRCWHLAQLDICVVLTGGWHIANICWQVLTLVQLDICVVLTGGWHIANICWQVLAFSAVGHLCCTDRGLAYC